MSDFRSDLVVCRKRRCIVRCKAIATCLIATLSIQVRAQADEDRHNYFNDPFVQATNGLSGCPQPDGPAITKAQMLAESHYRADRGINCFQAGRCRLPNSYLYDAEIVPRAKKAILAAGTFFDTSIWLEGQRRWVWLKGCARSEDQSRAVETLVRNLDDVEAVINQLTVKE